MWLPFDDSRLRGIGEQANVAERDTLIDNSVVILNILSYSHIKLLSSDLWTTLSPTNYVYRQLICNSKCSYKGNVIAAVQR